MAFNLIRHFNEYAFSLDGTSARAGNEHDDKSHDSSPPTHGARRRCCG